MDQDFIADDEENTQETGELSGLTNTGEEESQSLSRDSHHPRQGIPSRRVSPLEQSPPEWYLDGMKEISDMDGDDDEVVGYLVDRSRKNQAAAEASNDGEVSREWSRTIPEPDPPFRIQTSQMNSRGGGGSDALSLHHGFAISKNQCPAHLTLHHRTAAIRMAMARKE